MGEIDDAPRKAREGKAEQDVGLTYSALRARFRGGYPSRLRSLTFDRFILIVFPLGAFAIYLRTLAPGVLDGDSAEWQYIVNILGIPHSTGYPLYIFLGKLFTLLPLSNPAWRVNLFSAVCAALSLPFIYLVALRLSGSRAGSLIAAAALAFAPALWASAVEAEVYALNTCLLAIILYLSVRWHDRHQPLDLYLTALVFGLALDNHRISLFIAPALLALVWYHRRWLNAKRAILASILVVLPLLLYLYIPLRATQLLQQQSAADWQLYPRAEAILKGTVSAYYNNSPSAIIGFITGFDNRNKLGFQDTTSDALTTRLGNGVSLLFQQFNPIDLGFALVGLAFAIRRDRFLTLFLCIWGAGVGAISLALHAESTRFYFGGSYIIIAILLSVGIGVGLNWSKHRNWLHLGIVGLVSLLPVAALVGNYSSMDKSNMTEYDSYARTVLQDNIEPDAVVIAPWEIVTGLRYLQFVEGMRPDLLLIHESPVRPQFQRLLASAHSLRRPFYYVQFDPEERDDASPRTIQAVGLPLLSQPFPRNHLDATISDSVRVLGYDLNPDPASPGKGFRLSVYYHVIAPDKTQFISGLDLTDIRGEPHGDWQQPPVSQYYPTYFWQQGEFYRDVWDITLPADAPRGLYNLQLSWYPFDPVTNATHYEDGHSVTLGPIRAGDFGVGAPPVDQSAEFSNGMTLFGYGIQVTPNSGAPVRRSGDTIAISRGQALTVSLYWSAARSIDKAFTIYVHLEDSSGLIRSQSDRPPWNGMFPTDRWQIGERVSDDYAIQIPQQLPAGDYSLRVGVYSTPDKRVPLVSGEDQLTLDSRLHLTGE